jgi:hypothetical protein
MKRLLIITYYFPPVVNPSVQRPYFYSKLLPQHGWDVNIITKQVTEKWTDDEILDTQGMDIHKIKTWEWPKLWNLIHKCRLWFLFKHIFFHERWGFVLPAAQKANQLFKEKKFDAVLISMPPDIFGLIPVFLKLPKNCQVILDFRDPSYGYECKVWNNPLHKLFNFFITRYLVKKKYKINSNSDDNEEYLTKLFPDLQGRTSSVVNGFSKEFHTPASSIDTKFTLSYTGTLDRAVNKSLLSKIHSHLLNLGSYTDERIDFTGRSLIYITQAFEMLKDLRPDIFDKIHFDMAGVVCEYDWQQLEKVLGKERCRFQKNVTLHETQNILRSSHVLFLPQWENDYTRVVLGKLYEYLGMRRPILACVSAGQMRKMLDPLNLACCAKPNDAEAICKALIEMHDNYSTYSESALTADISQYSRDNQVRRMVELLNR